MRAIILCTSPGDEPGPLDDRHPTGMLPLVDRPMLQHVIEALVAQDVRELDLVLGDRPELVEGFVDDGSRWGCAVRYHLPRDPSRPARTLRILAGDADEEPVVLARADVLPSVDLAATRPAGDEGGGLFVRTDGEATAWTGWAWIRTSWLGALSDDDDADALEPWLLAREHMSRHKVDALDTRNVHGLRDANRRVIGGTFDGLLTTGREVEPGVWLSRNVMLHPTARVTAPVYLGPNTRIGAGAQLGPHAVIGANTILDRRATVADSLVLPGSYVGEGLDLDGVLVDRNRLVNLEHGASYTVTDGFILGSTETAGLRGWLRRLLGRLVAVALLLLGWPALLLTWLLLLIGRRGPVWHQLDALALPAERDETTWRTTRLRAFVPLTVRDAPPSPRDLLLRVLPLMTCVLTGRLWLVGVPPRSPDEVRELGADWRALLLGAKAGVIWEAHVSRPQDEDAVYAAESYYVAQGSLLHDIRLVLGYARRTLFPPCRRRPERHRPVARRS